MAAMLRRPKPKRTYTKVARAAAEEETRARIVEALIALHQEIGPARTTVLAIADRAGVERLTVYRHFPTEELMFQACSSLYMQRNPPPEPPSFDGIEPAAAVRRAVAEVYAWYRRNEAMFTNVLLDAERMPSVIEPTRALHDYVDALATRLDRLFARRSAHRRATLHHALEFNTWRSLSRLTASDRAAADVAAGWVSPRD